MESTSQEKLLELLEYARVTWGSAKNESFWRPTRIRIRTALWLQSRIRLKKGKEPAMRA